MPLWTNTREIQQALADPRTISDQQAEEMISQGRAIVMINCSIHASEVGASQMSLQLAYDLATKKDPQTQRILDNVILLLTPDAQSGRYSDGGGLV